jgi:hypothetical protein
VVERRASQRHMSHGTYQTKWTECMQELMEQVHIENLPKQAEQNGQKFEVHFQHYALLYIKYLQIYKKLEDCYDQMVHPQKRRSIKKVLKSTIVRILELKEKLILQNPKPDRFVALDEVLTDLKLNPETIEWRVPRYFLDDRECKEEIEDKQHKIDHWLQFFQKDEKTQDLIDATDPFEIGLNTDQAVERIQKNERGRLGIIKVTNICEWRKETQKKEEASKRKQERGDSAGDDAFEMQVLAATRIAAHWKRKVDRKRFMRMRQDEFEFLGMQKPENASEGVFEEMAAARQKRKKMQEDADDVYEKALKDELEWLHKKKGADIKADLLEERRQWILDYMANPEKAGNPLPLEFDEFYKELDKDEEAEDPKGKDAKGKDAKGKDPKAKGKDKGAGEEDAVDFGISPMVYQFVDHIQQYTEMWEPRNEVDNFDQRHDTELARKSVFPIVEAELRAVVDEMMKEELENLKKMLGNKKQKKQKKAKKIKPPKPKKWTPAVGTPLVREDLVPDLVEAGILKKIKPCYLSEFLGEYHYLGAMMRAHNPDTPAPSAQMTRSLLVEHCILPLAATDIRQKAPETLVARSILLFGPKGTGKSMLARAIATEAGATFFDISPKVIDGKFTVAQLGKLANSLLIYKTFLAAQDMAPSVIYFDECEQIFSAGKKKKGGDANGPSRIKKDLLAAIRQVKRGPDASEQDRILFIGCSSQPIVHPLALKTAPVVPDDKVMGGKTPLNDKEKPDPGGAFDEKIWVSFPEYGSRVLLWQKFMEQLSDRPLDHSKFQLGALAQVSASYPAGSIKQTVTRVLTSRRVQKLKERALKEDEFIGPLSRTSICYDEENQCYNAFQRLTEGKPAWEKPA